jgi:hypothetical protein
MSPGHIGIVAVGTAPAGSCVPQIDVTRPRPTRGPKPHSSHYTNPQFSTFAASSVPDVSPGVLAREAVKIDDRGARTRACPARERRGEIQ